MVDVDRFWRDGFLIIRQALDTVDVQRWRAAVLRRENVDADLLTHPVLQEVVLHPLIIQFARELLEGQPIYFGDSTADIGTGGWGFHKDNSDRLDANAPDWKTDRYPIIRFGVYTKRHGGSEPGSIEFRKGSHMHADFTTGERYAAPSEPGDLLVWNSRTTHSGNSRILRGIGYRFMPDTRSITFRAIRKMKAEWLMRPESSERVALFVSYGREDPLLHRHMAYLRTREYAWDKWGASCWAPQAKELALQRGLGLIDPTGYRREPGARLNRDYAPLPY